ncbi:hypothetical protein SDJN03_27459, partial [Cucurbita argyrosperma subsp. sororia]
MARIHLFVLFLSSLILFVNAQFEYFQMVQQWPLATCTGTPCLNPPSNKFTIHGLWPSNFSNAILVCKGSTFNSTNTAFLALEPLLNQYWPDLISKNNRGFWRYEWNKHGTCSESVFNQVQYFQTTLNIRTNPNYDLLAILKTARLIPTGSISHRYHVIEGAIRAAIGKKPGLRCNINKKTRNSQLHEIVLCFDKNGVTLIDCPFPRKCPTQFKWLLS